jgi:hypothetical protein
MHGRMDGGGRGGFGAAAGRETVSSEANQDRDEFSLSCRPGHGPTRFEKLIDKIYVPVSYPPFHFKI